MTIPLRPIQKTLRTYPTSSTESALSALTDDATISCQDWRKAGDLLTLPPEVEAGEVSVSSGIEVPVPSPMTCRTLPQAVDLTDVFRPPCISCAQVDFRTKFRFPNSYSDKTNACGYVGTAVSVTRCFDARTLVAFPVGHVDFHSR